MVWKYGNPFLYPTDEFNQLKSIIYTQFATEDFKRQQARTAPADLAKALNISEGDKAKAKKLSQSMTDFLKGPLT